MREENRPKEKSKYKIWEPMLLAIMVVIGMIAGQKMGSENNMGTFIGIDKEKSSDGERLEEIIHFIEERYVEDVDSEKLVEKAIESVIEELDPHSLYLAPELSQDLGRKMAGTFEGIGIEFFRENDTLILSYIMPKGPAEGAGLSIGDRLVTANGELLAGPEVSYDDILQRLKDKKGTQVHLVINRPGIGPMEISLVRDVIPIKSVSAFEMIDEATGYIKIERFGSKTYKEFMDAVEILVDQQKMQHLVIDVRKNPGGYLQPAVNMLSQLFEERGKLLLYTEGENSKRTDYKTTGNQFFKIDKVAVLIDKNSASASEILAGAIQDHDRGIIIGQQSYGKGLVQEEYELSNGGSLRLTIAKYFTPSGRLIQRPYDAEKDPGHESYYDHNGEKDTADSTYYYTDKGRVVFGSGGVEPDITVPPLIDFSDPQFNYLYDYLVSFSTHYIVSEGKGIDSLDEWKTLLDAHPDIGSDFLAYVEKSNESAKKILTITPQTAENIHLPSLVRASILSCLYGDEEWYKELNDVDPVVQKALEVLNTESLYTEQLD